MAKLATPRLIDVAPTYNGLETICDRLTEVAVDAAFPAKPAAVRITVSTESGTVGAAIMLSLGDDNGRPYFADCTLALAKDAPAEVTSRVNRLLNGYAIQRSGLTTVNTRKSVAPKVGKYWRTGEISMFHAGRIHPTPVLAEGRATVNLASSSVTMFWGIQPYKGTNLMLSASSGWGTVLTPSAHSKPKARKAQTVRQMVTPKVTNQPTSTPSVTPKGVTEDPMVTPKVTVPEPKPTPTVPVNKLTVTSLPAGHPGLFRILPQPKAEKGSILFHTTQVIEDDLTEAVLSFMTGQRTVALLRGPSGAGKTLAAQTIAARNGLPFRKFDVAGMRDWSDWTGSTNLVDGPKGVVTEFTPSDFFTAVAVDGPYAGIPRIVLLDEATRTETGVALNALTGILDDTATIYVPEARKSLHVDPAVLFMLTANIGAAYSGTTKLDEAIANRMTHWVMVDFPDSASETLILIEQTGISRADATKLVEVAIDIRAKQVRGEIESSISTRQLVQVGKRLANGRNMRDAFRVSYIQRLDAEGGGDSEMAKIIVAVNAKVR